MKLVTYEKYQSRIFHSFFLQVDKLNAALVMGENWQHVKTCFQ